MTKLKQTHDIAMQDARDLLGIVNSDDSWTWARSDALLGPIKAAMSNVEDTRINVFLLFDFTYIHISYRTS